MPASALLRPVRLTHLYLGVFISPALLFFAFTGFLQTFSLHETTRGSSYVPPRWAVVLGQIHKKQTAVVPVRGGGPPPPQSQAKPGRESGNPAAQPRPKPGPDPTSSATNPSAEAGPSPGAAANPSPRTTTSPRPQASPDSDPGPRNGPAQDPGPRRHPLPLKIFFGLVSLGLLTSTLTGIYMAYKYTRSPAVITALLVAGTLIPIALVFV